MTPAEASDLVQRMAATWPRDPWGDQVRRIWLESLASVDAGAAGTAYVRLRGELDRAPSVARFVAECGATPRAAAARERERERATVCGRCDGSGWEFTSPNAVVRCPCPPSEQQPVAPRMPLVRS